MRSILVVFLIIASTSAHGSAGLNCEADDKSVRFKLEAGISRGAGEGFFSFSGKLEIRAASAPSDFRTLAFDKEHLTQRWLDGQSLKMRIYREREGEPHGYVDLVIEARPRKGAEDLEFSGRYALSIFELPKGKSKGRTTTLKGRVTCSLG